LGELLTVFQYTRTFNKTQRYTVYLYLETALHISGAHTTESTIFQYTRTSNKTQRYTVYLNLETALHISGGTSNHHQERIQLYLQHLVFVTPLLLSAAIVEELEPV
jgi:hypothetical protein